jgi:hypothetical protein
MAVALLAGQNAWFCVLENNSSSSSGRTSSTPLIYTRIEALKLKSNRAGVSFSSERNQNASRTKIVWCLDLNQRSLSQYIMALFFSFLCHLASLEWIKTSRGGDGCLCRRGTKKLQVDALTSLCPSALSSRLLDLVTPSFSSPCFKRRKTNSKSNSQRCMFLSAVIYSKS